MNRDAFPFCTSGKLPLPSIQIEPCNYETKSTLRSEMIEIYPTLTQLNILKKWFNIYRWSYNQAIKWYRSHPPKDPKSLNFNNLRKKLTKKYFKVIYKHTARKKNLKKTRTGIPKHTIDNAFRDVITAYKAAFENYKNGNIKKFRLRYKKETNDIETLCLETSSFSKSKNGFAIKTLGEMASSKQFGLIKHDSRLTWNKKINKILLSVPKTRELYECQDRKPFISLDPGIRVFQTGYDTEKTVSIGVKEANKILNLLIRINKVENKKEENKKEENKVEENKKDYRHERWYKKFIRKRWLRIQNIRDDLHWKTALKLVRNYDLILVGNMSTMSIVSREDSKLNSITKQKCLMLSHHKFNSRLKAKAEEYGSQIEMVDERYTTKTCGACSNQQEMGGKEKYDCQRCGFKWGRDENAARNIALKYFDLF